MLGDQERRGLEGAAMCVLGAVSCHCGQSPGRGAERGRDEVREEPNLESELFLEAR